MHLAFMDYHTLVAVVCVLLLSCSTVRVASEPPSGQDVVQSAGNSVSVSSTSYPCDMIIVNHHYPYENLNGAVNRLLDVIQSILGLDMRIHFVFEHYDEFAEKRLERWTHPNVNMIQVEPTDKPNGVRRQLMEGLTGNKASFPFRCQQGVTPVALSFPWAWRESFIDVQLEIHHLLASELGARVVQVFDDNPFLYYTQGRLGFDQDFIDRMLNATTYLFFDPHTYGFVGISNEVTSSLAQTSEKFPQFAQGRRSPKALGNFPFSFAITDIEHHSQHASYADSHVDFLLMGDMHAANVEALKWLCRELAPKLQNNEKFHIVGKVTMEATCDHPNAVNHDFVSEQELEDLLFHAKMLVAPITVHTGVSTKVAKALTFGVPVVATRDAFAGVKDNMSSCRHHQPVVERPLETFVQAALDLARDKNEWETLQKAALPCSLITFSRSHLEKGIYQVLKGVQTDGNAGPLQ